MGFLFFVFFRFCCVLGPFFLHFCQAQKVFYHKKSGYYLQIKHNRSFYHKKKYFSTILVFLSFCHDPRKIAKEEKEIEI